MKIYTFCCNNIQQSVDILFICIVLILVNLFDYLRSHAGTLTFWRCAAK